MMSLQAKAIQEDYKNADEKARISYAFGMLVASNLKSIDLELDYKALSDGIKAMIENLELEFTEQEAMEIVEAALQKSMDKTSEENERREIEFLANNKQRPEIKVTPSGLQYEIITETDGEKPDGKSIVRVYYTGTFTDGTPFDSSNEDEGAYIPLEMVISGWTEGLMLMSVGSKYRFYIPSELAYGKEGIQSIIPPYSTLIFTVELLEITEGEDSEE
jgi:FKBP-type peptidyl-prolyl cis-trans isomerase FkpA/FKBP-type peptidyl-prolyl cis-trans isomerase FklB